MKRKYIYHVAILLQYVIPFSIFAQSSNQNYVLQRTMLNESGSDNTIDVKYYDGFGRLMQTARNGTNRYGYCQYNYIEYDAIGRIEKEWSPYIGNSSGTYYPFSTYSGNTRVFYNDNMPYSSNRYDALDRSIEQTTPGQSFSDHPAVTRFLSNGSTAVKRYEAPAGGGLSDRGYYLSGSLSIEESTDPDGKKISVYKDIEGHTVLERRGDFPYSDTYFVYNDLGLLVYVLSPMYQENPDIALFAYCYTYDNIGRLKTKKLPGCDVVEYWYDDADRVIYMQDGLLRDAGKYRFTMYDNLNRMVIQGTCSNRNNATTPFAMNFVSSANGFQNTGYSGSYGSYSNVSLEIVNYYDSLHTAIFNKFGGTFQPLRDSLDINNGVSQKGQLVCTYQSASNGEKLISSFIYDQKGRLERTAGIGLGRSLSTSRFDYTFTDEVKKETIAEYKRNSNGSLSRIVYATKENIFDIPHTKLLHQSVLKIKDASGVTQTETIQTLTYDNLGNVVGIDRGGTAADMTYQYDLLHGWVKQISSAGGFQQILKREDFASNRLYNGSIASMTWKAPGESAVRRYDYQYDDMNRLLNATYSELSSNSSGISNASTIGNDENDGRSELMYLIPESDMDIFEPNAGVVGPYGSNEFGEAVTYDRNSNIISVVRHGLRNNGQYGLIDNLTLERNGNQLKWVNDAISEDLTYNGASDFYDGLTLVNGSNSIEYEYNSNGSLTKDSNKGITNISYDNLGNPRTVTFNLGKRIEYVYAADGRRLRTIHRSNSSLSPSLSVTSTDSIDYRGNLILKQSMPSQYLFDGGYASFSLNHVNGFHYYIQDYMGNNRAVVRNNNTVEQVTHYYPYGGVIGGIGTGESLQPYKFEGKELDRTFGLDWYDIQARQYDAIGVPGWTSIDPLAEKYYGISPYVMCAGNPVNCIDLYGDSITILGSVADFVSMLYNALPSGIDMNFRVVNGVIDPCSIPDSEDSFLSDLRYVATHEQMVDIDFAEGYDYLDNNGDVSHVNFNTPTDTDDMEDLGFEQYNNLKARGIDLGKSMSGNTGVSLFAQGNAKGNKPLGGRNLLLINSRGSMNHRSIGFAHELIHFSQYFKGKPYAHPQIDNYLYPRMQTLIHRLGYDY